MNRPPAPVSQPPVHLPRRRPDPEDRRFAALLALSAALVLGAVGWALHQGLPEAPVLVHIPDRVMVLLMPPDPAPPPPPGALGPGVWVERPVTAPGRRITDLHPHSVPADHDDLFDVSDWVFAPPEPEAPPLLRAPDPGVGGAPLPDVGVGPLARIVAPEARITPVQASFAPTARTPPPVDRPPRIDSGAVRDLLRTQRRDLQACTERVGHHHPGAQGRFVLELRSEGDGRVTVSVEGPRGAELLERCLAPLARRWRLPPGAAGTARSPLVLVPAG